METTFPKFHTECVDIYGTGSCFIEVTSFEEAEAAELGWKRPDPTDFDHPLFHEKSSLFIAKNTFGYSQGDTSECKKIETSPNNWFGDIFPIKFNGMDCHWIDSVGILCMPDGTGIEIGWGSF